MNKRAIQIKKAAFPYKDSVIALTFEAEIKRLAIEKSLEMGTIIDMLSEKIGVGTRHLYNYRSGKTDIPAMTIPVLCKQFGSNALAMAVVVECNEIDYDEMDMFDLGRFASRSVQESLRGHDDFLDAFDDGTIDGHEITKLSLSTAKIIRNANRLLELAQDSHDRRHPPTAARRAA